MSKNSEYSLKREQADICRAEARGIQYMFELAGHPSGLSIQFGTYRFPRHIALRIADSLQTWKKEYEDRADALEAEMEAMLR